MELRGRSLLKEADLTAAESKLAAASGAQLTITADITTGVAAADFLYTDVWLSMGEPVSEWDERIDQRLPTRSVP